ncbi:hypothetical protein AJ85_11455 [Alkalihalobacillus alcalophilus ATCC 27647 = CGMCC 1.3604]|uniref:Thiamine-binding protein domain-containing protein n=1 Tax=Alkalihalobacillus alcalophilus ATCC 27647 = CGMCC 1.3604 TaxID=1218173 RepID=A0A094WSA2_ALKAL|nr:thiamine-binding protein [Alkalihalobacillus alcalophilus]KGA98938.1 hypothetical protein BALCAV_0201405 [Alkalihalobacillus alcalophilus ATCC 27647 = CGMCC 1.3604]MED1561970.1 thiamine-binding protein [Alkalihalobacillus alcalophilus]THG90337.1 hypothetical protein AJ85_11455 [Alkalihalobacillus alcalophilus ATCC 27647 = CGMCC 1.3604]
MTTVLAGFQLLPNQKEDHTGGIIEETIETIENSGLRYQVGPLETVVEGDFDSIMTLVKDIHVKAFEAGADEFFSNIKIHYRVKGVSLEDKKI